MTNALENMKQKGTKFKTGAVTEWLDCGNKNATVFSNQRVLEFEKDKNNVSDKATIENSIIIQPCLVADGAIIKNSVIGPHVSVGNNTVITNCIVENSIIQNDSILTGANFADSMVGNHAKYVGKSKDLSIGDYTEIKD